MKKKSKCLKSSRRRCYYPHWSRDSVSPICVFFFCEGSPPPTCHVSHVMRHVSCFMCHMSNVTFFILFFFLDKVVKLVGGESVSNGATLSILVLFNKNSWSCPGGPWEAQGPVSWSCVFPDTRGSILALLLLPGQGTALWSRPLFNSRPCYSPWSWLLVASLTLDKQLVLVQALGALGAH